MDKLRSKLDSDSKLTFETVELTTNVEHGYAVIPLREVIANKTIPQQADPFEPHRVNFHALILFTEGTGTHWVEWTSHQVKPNSLIHIYPNQLHHFGDTSGLDAWCVLFLPSVLPVDFHRMSTSVVSDTPSSSFFESLKYQWPQVASVKPEEGKILRRQIKLLYHYQKSRLGHEFQLATRHQICSFVALAHQFAIHSVSDDWESKIPPLFLKFVELLESSFTQSRDAKWYAKELDCAYKTLSRTCTSTTGKSPKTLIDERVSLEATRRLAYSEETVGQIGSALGFEENTNFTKFFRRVTGQTPDEYRRSKLGD